MIEAEEGESYFNISTKYSPEDLETSLKKISVCSYKYQNANRSLESLQSIKTFLTPNEFREVVLETFGLSLSPNEWAATINYYSANSSGLISIKKFLFHFIKLGSKKKYVKVKRNREKDNIDSNFILEINYEE